jgi:hypothetical protein
VVHQASKAVIVMPHDEMRHFMEHNVFKTFRRLLGKFSVEPNALGTKIATPILSSSFAQKIARL